MSVWWHWQRWLTGRTFMLISVVLRTWLCFIHKAVAQAQEGTFLGIGGLLCAGCWNGGSGVSRVCVYSGRGWVKPAFRSHLDCICWQIWPSTSSWPHTWFSPSGPWAPTRTSTLQRRPRAGASLSSRTAWLRSRETSGSGTGAWRCPMPTWTLPSLRTAFPFNPLLLTASASVRRPASQDPQSPLSSLFLTSLHFLDESCTHDGSSITWTGPWTVRDQSGSVRGENLLTEVKRAAGPWKGRISIIPRPPSGSLLWKPSLFPIFYEKRTSSHQAQLGTLNPPPKSSLIPKYLLLCHLFVSTFLPS